MNGTYAIIGIVGFVLVILGIKLGCKFSKKFADHVHSDEFLNFGGNEIIARITTWRNKRKLK